MKSRRRILIVLSALTTILIALFLVFNGRDQTSQNRMPETVSYNFHIRPILSDRCFKCHGPDAKQRKADLRLDTEDGAFAALKDNPNGHVTVPGKPDESELFLRISSADTSMVMPPPSSNLKLSEFEIELIEKWIKQGAKYEKHWAFLPPKSYPVPEADDWATNELDHFTYASMRDHGLKPNEEADKERLLKRVYFDIIGLPPS